MTRTRLTAAAAALTVTGGAATMLVVLVAGPGPWWQGYVSEAGAAARPHAIAYRCGLVLLAFGVLLLAVALRRRRDLPAVAVCLAVAAALAGLSGVVPCTDRCPLPPFEPTTVMDVVHTAASILGLFVLAATMAVTCFAGTRAAARRLAWVALSFTVPLGLALGLTMVIIGRCSLAAILERLVLFVATSWLVGTALLAARAPAANEQPADMAGNL